MAPKFTAMSLGLVHSHSGLTLKDGTSDGTGEKKKLGRPSGLKNKKPTKKQLAAAAAAAAGSARVSGADVLSYLYSGHPPSPSSKGKEQI